MWKPLGPSPNTLLRHPFYLTTLRPPIILRFRMLIVHPWQLGTISGPGLKLLPATGPTVTCPPFLGAPVAIPVIGVLPLLNSLLGPQDPS